MNATPATPDLRASTPEHQALAFAGRFALIIASLVALIARGFLRDPKLALLTIPLCRRLTRNARHLTAIMARLAAGRLGRAAKRSGVERGRGALAPRERSRAPKPPIPATHAWLVLTLKHEAAGYASQLSHLLREPGVSDLLAAAPTTLRLLRPLCRMLGLPATALGAVAGDPAAGTQLCVPEAAGRAPSRTESAVLPAPPLPAARSLPPPPCPHVRWPWFPRPDPKPA